MIITSIEQKSQNQKSRYTIYVDGKYLTITDKEIIDTNQLKVGTVLDEALYDKIFADSAFRKARERALHLLLERGYTEKELFEKVGKTNDLEVTQKAIDFLKSAGIVDDKKYAATYAYEATQYRKWGKERIIRQLKAKGMDIFDIEDALEGFEFNSLEAIEDIIEHKLARKLYEKNGIAKTCDNLYKMGYSRDEIAQVMVKYKTLVQENHDSIPREEIVEEIIKLIKSKYHRKLLLQGGEQKVFAALCRRGYKYPMVKEAMNQYSEQNIQED